MRAYRSAALTGFIVGSLSGVIALSPVGLDIEEGLGLQWLFQIRGPLEPPGGLVIINIAGPLPQTWGSEDGHHEGRACLERLRESLGDRLPRCAYTKIVQRLDRWGASVIAFDVFFGEAGDPAEDAALAEAMAQTGRTVLLQRAEKDSVGSSNFVVESVQSPVAPFAEAAAGLGPFPMPKVPARVNQFWAFKPGAGDSATLPALVLQLHALPWLEHIVRIVAVEGTRDGDRILRVPVEISGAEELTRIMRGLRGTLRDDPLDPARLIGEVNATAGAGPTADERDLLGALMRLYSGPDSYFLNFYGPPGTIRTFQAQVVLDPDAAAGGDLRPQIRDSVVFVGRAAHSVATQRDGHYTVFSRPDGLDLSGVEIAASAYANLLNDQVLRRANNFWILLIVITGCILVGIGSYRRSPIKFTASTLGVIALYLTAAVAAFIHRGVWMPVILPAVGQLATIGTCLILRAGFVHGPPRLVYGVCLLTDIGHFTETTEKFKSRPKNMVHRLLLRIGVKQLPLMSALRAYFKLLGEIIESWGGTVLHQVGDSMICIWPVRERHDNGVDDGREIQRSQAVRKRACQAALEIERRVTAFNDALAVYTESGERLDFPTRIGVDVGHFETGYFGRTFRTELLMIGDPANTASRLEQLNKVLGTQILSSQPVIDGLDPQFVVRWVGTYVLSGKSEELEVFELRGRRDSEQDAFLTFCRRFEDALRQFAEVSRTTYSLPENDKKRAWDGVVREFHALRQECPPDGPTKYFLDLAETYSGDPPKLAEWPLRMTPKKPA